MKVDEFNAKKRFSEASGVSAVLNDKIKIELNEYGNFEENVYLNENHDLDPMVEYVSPSFNKEINESDIAKKLYNNINEINYDKRIGYYTSLYAGYVNEGNYRENASSGGMGTWIFKELFEKDLIDGVIHVKENIDKGSPVMFHYDISRSIDEIRAGAKTKYYPFEFSKVLTDVKESPVRYARIGIPSCTIAIRLLADEDTDIK